MMCDEVPEAGDEQQERGDADPLGPRGAAAGEPGVGAASPAATRGATTVRR